MSYLFNQRFQNERIQEYDDEEKTNYFGNLGKPLELNKWIFF